METDQYLEEDVLDLDYLLKVERNMPGYVVGWCEFTADDPFVGAQFAAAVQCTTGLTAGEYHQKSALKGDHHFQS